MPKKKEQEQEQNIERKTIELELNGVKVQLTTDENNLDLLKQSLSLSEVNIINSKEALMNLPSTNADLNDYQIVWNNIGKRPSTLYIDMDIHIDNVWSVLEEEFEFDDRHIVKDVKVYTYSDIYASRNFVEIDEGLYILFEDKGNGICTNIEFTYDHTYYPHNTVLENVISCFYKHKIEYDVEDDSDKKLFLVDYTDRFVFKPIELEDSEYKFDKKEKTVYNKIVKDINTNSDLYIIHGKRHSGKTKYLRELVKKIKKQILYVPIDTFENVFHNSKQFFEEIELYKNSVIIFDDCEMYFKTYNYTNLYSSIILNKKDSLLSYKNNNTIILVMNDDLTNVCESLVKHDKIKYIDLDKKGQTEFKGY